MTTFRLHVVFSCSANPLTLALLVQDAGEAALNKLDTALTEFQGLIDAKDKQTVPIKQRECLDYVGQVREQCSMSHSLVTEAIDKSLGHKS